MPVGKRGAGDVATLRSNLSTLVRAVLDVMAGEAMAPPGVDVDAIVGTLMSCAPRPRFGLVSANKGALSRRAKEGGLIIERKVPAWALLALAGAELVEGAAVDELATQGALDENPSARAWREPGTSAAAFAGLTARQQRNQRLHGYMREFARKHATRPLSERAWRSIGDALTDFERNWVDAREQWQESRAKSSGRLKPSTSIDEVLRHLEQHPKSHLLDDAFFLWERCEEILQVIEDGRTKGRYEPLARLAVLGMPWLYIFEKHEQRSALGSYIFEVWRSQPNIGVSTADALLLHVEGTGLSGDRRHDENFLKRHVITDDTRERIEAAWTQRSPPKHDRALLLAKAHFQRRQAELKPHLKLKRRIALYREAVDLALQAHHESIAVSIARDLARLLHQNGCVPAARQELLRAKGAALAQDNQRRLITIELETARLALDRGTRRDVREATVSYLAALRRYETVNKQFPASRGFSVKGDWYQSSFRGELDRLRARLEAVDAPLRVDRLLRGAAA